MSEFSQSRHTCLVAKKKKKIDPWDLVCHNINFYLVLEDTCPRSHLFVFIGI